MKRNFKILCLLLLLTIFACGKKETKEVKDTLIYGQMSDPKTLNPQMSTDQYSQTAMAQIYDRLFEINEETGEPIPSLAKSYERKDENTLAITLNEKAKFHNGDYLKAEDVKFTLEKAKKSPVVGHLYKLIDNVEIVDDQHILIHTTEPFAPLLNHLSHKSASILNKKAFEEMGEEKYYLNPVGTGAYKLANWEIGNKLTLTAVPGYFKGDAKIKNIEIRSIPEENSKVIGLETGEIDIASDVPAISWEDMEKDGKINIKTNSSTMTAYMGLNTKKGILQDKDVRKAIAMAIDKDAIIDTIYLGKVKKAEQLASPVIFGHNKDGKALPYNPEESKKIIEEKGLVGAKLTVIVSNPERVQIATIIQAQLKEIGIDLVIESIEWGTFLAMTGSGAADMFIMAWGPSTYDGDYAYYPNLHSGQLGSNGNRTYYENLQMDEYLDLAKKELDVEKRRGLYDNVRKLVSEDNPLIPLFHMNTIYGVRSNVKNVEALGYPMFYKYEFSE